MLSEQLKIIRKANGFTQVELAKVIGIERSTYASYETGRNRPDISVLGKIAAALGVTVDYIINIDPLRGIVLSDTVKEYGDTNEPRLLCELSPQERMLVSKLRLDRDKFNELFRDIVDDSDSNNG